MMSYDGAVSLVTRVTQESQLTAHDEKAYLNNLLVVIPCSQMIAT